MNLKSFGIKWKICKVTAAIGMSWWALETIFFLVRDGWHIKAIAQAEKNADTIVEVMLTIAYVLLLSLLCDVVQAVSKSES